MKYGLRFITLLGVVVVLSACSGWGPPALERGSMPGGSVGHLRISALAPMGALDNVHPFASLENDGMTRILSLQRIDQGFTAEAEHLPIGDWLLSVEFRDENGDVTHRASQTVRVYANQQSLVEIEVGPVDATFEVLVDLSDFPDRDLVLGVRVNFVGGSYFTLSPVEGEEYVFHGGRQAEAGDYEFSVALYGESYRASDRIYESPWNSVRLVSGKTVQAVWSAELGQARVQASIVDLPPTPEAIQCDVRSDELWVVWDTALLPAGVNVRIWTRHDEYEHFKKFDEVDGALGEWLLTSDPSSILELVLTSVDADGRESYRSPALIPSNCLKR